MASIDKIFGRLEECSVNTNYRLNLRRNPMEKWTEFRDKLGSKPTR